MSDMRDGSRHHVVISGGSRGLGQSLVEGLLGAGYAVTTFSRRATAFTNSRRDNPWFLFCQADLRNNASLADVVEVGCSRFGRPFGLINCAAIAVDGVLATMPPERIDEAVAVNLAGSLHLTRLVVRRMLQGSEGGVIVNISSIIGLRGYSGMAAIAAAKGGMDAATRALARELGPRGIRVNSVAPGYMATQMTQGLTDQQKQQILRRTPLGRLGVPADVVGPVLFLLSAEARFITGQVLVVDGGITA